MNDLDILTTDIRNSHLNTIFRKKYTLQIDLILETVNKKLLSLSVFYTNSIIAEIFEYNDVLTLLEAWNFYSQGRTILIYGCKRPPNSTG